MIPILAVAHLDLISLLWLLCIMHIIIYRTYTVKSLSFSSVRPYTTIHNMTRYNVVPRPSSSGGRVQTTGTGGWGLIDQLQG